MSDSLGRGKSVLKDVGLYGFGNAVSSAAGFLGLLVLARVFGPGRYGILATVGATTGLLEVFLILGADTALVRLFFDTSSYHDRQQVTTTTILSIGLWSLVLCALLVPLAAPVSQWLTGSGTATIPLVLGLATAPVVITNRLLGQTLRNQFRPASFVTVDIVNAALDLTFSLTAVLVLHMGVAGALAGTLVAEAVVVPARVALVRGLFRWPPSGRALRRLMVLGLPLVPSSLSYWIFQTSDRYVLARLTSLAQVGLYSYANLLMGAGTVFSLSVGMAWGPHALELARADPERASHQYGRMLTYLLAASGGVAVALTALSRPLIELFAGPRYLNAAPAVGPLALAFVAQVSVHVTAFGIYIAKRNRYHAQYAAYAAVVNVALCVSLVAWIGMVGAAWATAAAYLTLTLFCAWRSQRLWPIAYEVRRSLTVVAVTGAFTLGAMQLSGSSLVAALLGVAVSIGYLGAVVILGGLDRRDLDQLRSVLQSGGRSGEVSGTSS